MFYRLLADLVVIIHLLFIVFAILGGGLLLWHRWLVVLHIPAVIWAALIEFRGWICPLTPLENGLRKAAGADGYSGGFVEHYLIPLIYPPNLTAELQMMLGIIVIAVNLAVYAFVLYRLLIKRNVAK